ncbi:MAG TPA: hypothetical protein VMV41_16360, partial [Cellulomonadaceae bacterium]|nr:hypothetical protein [Cellulomonadaceae bacterium]
MHSLEGNRVIIMGRVGHSVLVSAITMITFLMPPAGRASADFRAEAISAPQAVAVTPTPRVDGVSTGSRFVTFDGVRVTVPATWPVIDLRENPEACVRFDTPAVYLGSPGSQSDCPAHAVGRVDT